MTIANVFAHHSLTITLDPDSYDFVIDVLNQATDADDDYVYPAAIADPSTNTVTFLNPTIADARTIADWLRDMLDLDATYATPDRPATARIDAFRYEHLTPCLDDLCTACADGYLDLDYFTD